MLNVCVFGTKQFYAILNEAAICQQMKEDIRRVSDVLSISEASACSLLIHFKWLVDFQHWKPKVFSF